MIIWAIVPVKPFTKAKSRLAPILSSEEREILAEKFFRHTLSVLTTTKEVHGVLVISRDNKALAIARDYGTHTVQESGAPELNAALTRAAQVVALQRANGVLILPADLPLLATSDVQEIVKLGRFHKRMVIAPDRDEEGTNALLVNPPDLIPFAYGLGSFKRHQELATQAEATIKVYQSPRVALDIDLPKDLDEYHRIIQESSSATLEPLA